MSILIKGMEMPKSCACCDIACRYYLDHGLDGLLAKICRAESRLPDCPLVPVPPHGRLIDADAPIPLVDTHGKNIEVTVAHIIENNLGIVNAIIESEASR